MNRKLALALIALFLTACATSRVKGDSPASDLDALQANVHRAALQTTLPNGKTYCVEDATTEGERDDCALDLEDAVFVGNKKLDNIVNLVDSAVHHIKLRLAPCGFWRGLFHPTECR